LPRQQSVKRGLQVRLRQVVTGAEAQVNVELMGEAQRGGLMKLVIDHLTRYGYDEEVKFSTQYLRLTPRSTCRSACARSSRVLKRRSTLS
jgi:hypothetical protein